MKKMLTLGIMTMLMLALVTTYSLAMEMAPLNVDEVLTKIRQGQGISSAEPIDLKKVSFGQFEELGDAVMELIVGNHDLHEQLDASLGGDGSATLTAFHTRLGYNYLNDYPNGILNLMSGGMMSGFGSGMMGGFGSGMMGTFDLSKCPAFNTTTR
jgi:hypothetical protein